MSQNKRNRLLLLVSHQDLRKKYFKVSIIAGRENRDESQLTKFPV